MAAVAQEKGKGKLLFFMEYKSLVETKTIKLSTKLNEMLLLCNRNMKL